MIPHTQYSGRIMPILPEEVLSRIQLMVSAEAPTNGRRLKATTAIRHYFIYCVDDELVDHPSSIAITKSLIEIIFGDKPGRLRDSSMNRMARKCISYDDRPDRLITGMVAALTEEAVAGNTIDLARRMQAASHILWSEWRYMGNCERLSKALLSSIKQRHAKMIVAGVDALLGQRAPESAFDVVVRCGLPRGLPEGRPILAQIIEQLIEVGVPKENRIAIQGGMRHLLSETKEGTPARSELLSLIDRLEQSWEAQDRGPSADRLVALAKSLSRRSKDPAPGS